MADSGVIVGPGPRPVRRRTSRRRKLLTRSAPVVVIAVAAFAAGATVATGPDRSERRTVTHYVRAWASGDTATMYGLLDSDSRARVTQREFADQLASTATTATATAMRVLHVGRASGHVVPVQMVVQTRVWGPLRETLRLPMSGSGSSARVALQASMLFPGLGPGETLHRHIRMPVRGTLLASDGTPLAQGADRTSTIPDVAQSIVGALAAIPADDAGHYAALGFPSDMRIGATGLERVFQTRLAGTPGGTLLAGSRTLSSVDPVAGAPVHTTIDPAIERAAVAALGNRYAGMAVMNPRTGGLTALAGIAFSALQPPGSTMKIVTSAAALQAKLATLSTTFPVQTEATIDGYTLQNANGEACGGTLINAFAVSCNSVFAPLGTKIGGRRLVAMAERFGFNHQPMIPGAAEPSIPSAAEIGSAVSVGSSAIGQGKVLSTPLEQADVAATIAMGGRRPIPTLDARATPRFVRVVSPQIARQIQQMMIAVVQYGTGTSAAIPGVVVAGKTGTAELKDTATDATGGADSNDPRNTDAWFVGYAPAGRPRVVAGALFPNAGAGAATAAPPVREALEAALAH